jgi:LPXTG-site transpeptidase (sortase) family protein
MNTSLRERLLLIIGVGSTVCLVALLIAQTYAPLPLLPPATGSGHVMRLLIPRIHIDAAIESVGLTPAGAMDVPKSPDDVAWFNRGPRPGERGSAVIAGHRDWENGKVAVFYDLHMLRAGDLLIVIDDKGTSVTFVVRETRTYDNDADTRDVFSSDSGIHLNLITCGGAWDVLKNIYTKRLVIFADVVH